MFSLTTVITIAQRKVSVVQQTHLCFPLIGTCTNFYIRGWKLSFQKSEFSVPCLCLDSCFNPQITLIYIKSYANTIQGVLKTIGM